MFKHRLDQLEIDVSLVTQSLKGNTLIILFQDYLSMVSPMTSLNVGNVALWGDLLSTCCMTGEF